MKIKKENTAFVLQFTKKTIAISSFLFLLFSLIKDLNDGGVCSLSGYAVTKSALGALGIGLGFGLASIVYTNEKLSRPVQTVIYMVIGCTVMLAITFLIGSIPLDRGLLPALLAIAFLLLSAFIVLLVTYRHQKKLADRINQELEQRQQ